MDGDFVSCNSCSHFVGFDRVEFGSCAWLDAVYGHAVKDLQDGSHVIVESYSDFD